MHALYPCVFVQSNSNNKILFFLAPTRVQLKKSMRNGLDKTEVALVFVTEEYQQKVNGAEDTNAQFEFYHIAADFMIPGAVIPIICEKSMTNRQNWNGYMAKISSLDGIDFSDAWGDDEASRLTFDAKCKELLLELRKKLTKLEEAGGRKQFTKALIEKEKEVERKGKEIGERQEAAKNNNLFYSAPIKVEQEDEYIDSSIDIEAPKTIELVSNVNPMHSSRATTNHTKLGFAAAMGGGGSSIARDDIPKGEK